MRLLFALVCLAFSPVVLGKEVVELGPDNLVRLVGEISDASASAFIQELYTVSVKSPVVSVYIDSPGGDVLAGIRMIDAVVGLKAVRPGVKLVCFAQTASSMAFVFFQTACDRRVVSDFSLLMSHQASLGVRGKAGEIETRMDLVRQLLSVLDVRVAARLGLSVEDYRTKIVNDWWLVGTKALDVRAADVLGVAACLPEVKQCPLVYVVP